MQDKESEFEFGTYEYYKSLPDEEFYKILSRYKNFYEMPGIISTVMLERDEERTERRRVEKKRLEQLKIENPIAYKKEMEKREKELIKIKIKEEKAKEKEEQRKAKEKEKREQKKKAKEEYNRVHPKKMSKEEKVLLAKALSYKNIFFGKKLNTINNIITKNVKNITVDTYKEALDIIIRIDIRELLGLSVNLKEDFSCGIIYNNTASIDVDKNGICRYFTWNPEHDKGYVFSYIDIVEIMNNLSYGKALNEILKQLKINVREGGWVNMQKEKYTNNITLIENADKELSKRYPNLFRYIKRNMIVLEKLNCMGLANVNIEENSFNGESIFFASMQHISDSLSIEDSKVDKTRVNRAINVFAILGLITKVPKSFIPSKFKKFKKINEGDHDITFFAIKEMDFGVLAEAELRAEQLKKAGVSATHITIEKIRQALGDMIADEVYGNTAIKTESILIKKEENKKKEKAS
jgi:hypothetical protein